MNEYDTITCLTDLGTSNESVGILHSVIREITPKTRIVDLCHEIPPGDTKSAALMLARSVPYLRPGIVLVAIGQHLERPAIAVEVGNGQSILVGPDNGTLGAAVAVVGGAQHAIQLVKPEHHIESPGAVDPGRDVIAPIAAKLAAGSALDELGEMIDPNLLLPSLMPVTRTETDGAVSAEVLWVDRFGSAQLNLDKDLLTELGDILIVEFNDEKRVVRLQKALDVASGQMALVEDIHGLISLVIGQGDSVAKPGLAAGSAVTIRQPS